MKKQFLVIGLGRFGMSLIKTLIQHKHEVLAVDKDVELVEDASHIATHAIQADCTDEDALHELGVKNFNHAIVAIGEDTHSSLLVTLLLKELGVKKVTAKAKSAIHGKMLEKLGADQVIYPERDMGIRLGKQLSSGNLIDYIELSPDYNLVEMKAPPAMDGKTLQQLNIRAKYGCNIIAIKHGEMINMTPSADDVIRSGDILLVMGNDIAIQHMEEKYD